MKFKIELKEDFPPWPNFYVLCIENDIKNENEIICAKLYCLYNQYILGDGTTRISINKTIAYYIIKNLINK